MVFLIVLRIGGDEIKHKDELARRRLERFNDEKLRLAREVIQGIREATDDVQNLLFEGWNHSGFYETLSTVPLLFSEPVVEVTAEIYDAHRQMVKLYQEHHRPGNTPTFASYKMQSDELRNLSGKFTEEVKRDMGIL